MTTLILITLLVLALIAAAPKLNTAHVPTPQDDALQLDVSATRTANFNGASKDLGLRFAPGGIGMAAVAVVLPTAVDRTSSDETYTFVLEESDDDSTYTAAGPSVAVSVSGATASLNAFSVPGFISKRYVRCRLTVAGTTPSITYQTWANFNL